MELLLNRAFRGGPKGRIASAVHHTVGKWVWGSFLRSALAAVEKQTASRSLTPGRTGRDAATGAQIHLNNTHRRRRKVLTTGLADTSPSGSAQVLQHTPTYLGHLAAKK